VIESVVGIALIIVVLIVAGLVAFAARTARRVEAAVPPLGRFIAIDGERIHYLDQGDSSNANGPPLLLIHGLTGQLRHFTHSLYDRLKNDYRVVLVDRPGSGYSTRAPRTPATLAVQATTIAHFAEAIGLDRPLVVGHSLGGAVALSLALNFPEQVGGLALIAPATHPPRRVPEVFGALDIKSRLLRLIVAWTLATPLSIRNGAHVLNTVFGPDPVPSDFGVNGGGLLTLRPSNFIGSSRDLVESRQKLDDMPARYKNLTMPIGILFGTADQILDPASHAEPLVRAVPAVDFELVEGAGHMIPLTDPDRCAQFIARMARRCAPARVGSPACAERTPGTAGQIS